MSNKTLAISMVVKDGPDGLKTLTMDADALKKAMSGALGEAKGMKKSLTDLGAVSFGLDAITSSLSSLQGMMKVLTDAYDVQVEAETKLETVMRQRMSATEAEIQSIKDLCSAQQQLGVIGDEVQLAGAQQVSTFLQTREALETLIPAMNNLVAQQKGLNATSGDAVTIGNLLGKAMQGQTTALRRVGITFSEAEEKAVKYGTEQERAAALAKIITNNVGEMNAALAATPSGKMKQAANNLGDLQERLGGMVKQLQPGITFINQMVLGFTNLVKIGTMINGIPGHIKAIGVACRATSVDVKILGFSMQANTVLTKTFALTFKASMMVVKTALISTGVGAGIWALGEGLAFVVNKLNGVKDAAQDTANAVNDVSDAQKSADQAMQDATAQITRHIAELKNWKGSKDEEKTKVEELNNTYGDTMGCFSSVKDWYDKLTSASELYAQQMVLEAKARIIANEIAETEIARQKAAATRPSSPQKTETPKGFLPGSKPLTTLNGESLTTLNSSKFQENIQNLGDSFDKYLTDKSDKARESLVELQEQMAKNARELKTGTNNKNGNKPPKEEILPKGSIAAYEKEISDLNKKISLAVDPASIAAMNLQIEEIKAKIEDMKIRAKIILDKDEFDKFAQQLEIAPYTFRIKAEVDPGIMKLKDLDLGASGWYRDFQRSQAAAQELQTKLNGVAETGRAASSAFSSMGDAMENPVLNIAGIIAGAIANIMAGYAAAAGKAGGQSSSPWEWIAFAVSGLATAVAAVASIKQATAFANGGIVSGPTMALVGEYAGASNNPEVIAPLNKLRELLPDEDSRVQRVVVTGRIKGSDIELTQRNRQRIHRK